MTKRDWKHIWELSACLPTKIWENCAPLNHEQKKSSLEPMYLEIEDSSLILLIKLKTKQNLYPFTRLQLPHPHFSIHYICGQDGKT